ncbi:hypothetical protein V1523DRAFT_465223 [Lipomyces doorenjongii]
MIWAKVLWIAWLAVMGQGLFIAVSGLTNDQKTVVHKLIHRVALLKSRAAVTASELDSLSLASVARLSRTLLLEQFDVMSCYQEKPEFSQCLILRAINLLSLRPS